MSMTHKRYLEKAKQLYQEGGEIEIDSDARISQGEPEDKSGGAYVQAWVWVPDDEEVEPS